MEWTYPRFIHSEIMTHRDRARNAASSRAIPWPKMMERITEHPVVPIHFGLEQRGMQSSDEQADQAEAERIWLEARDDAVKHAQRLADLGVHKSLCNRITEPWMWITVIMTATNWENLWRLRCHEDAERHFQKIAGMARDAMGESQPRGIDLGDWHLPYVDADDLQNIKMDAAVFDLLPVQAAEIACKVSTARCARVSYLTQDGKRDIAKDIELFDRLCNGSGFGHWSPHEHVATPATPDVMSGPYRGWMQYRKMFQHEAAKESEVTA